MHNFSLDSFISDVDIFESDLFRFTTSSKHQTTVQVENLPEEQSTIEIRLVALLKQSETCIQTPSRIISLNT